MRQIASEHFDDVGRTRDMNPKISRVQFVHGCSIFLVCWIPGSFVEKKKFWSTTGVRSTNVATSTNTTPVITSINHCDPNGIRTRVTAVKGRCPGPLDDRVTKREQYQNCYSWTQGKLPSLFRALSR